MPSHWIDKNVRIPLELRNLFSYFICSCISITTAMVVNSVELTAVKKNTKRNYLLFHNLSSFKCFQTVSRARARGRTHARVLSYYKVCCWMRKNACTRMRSKIDIVDLIFEMVLPKNKSIYYLPCTVLVYLRDCRSVHHSSEGSGREDRWIIARLLFSQNYWANRPKKMALTICNFWVSGYCFPLMGNYRTWWRNEQRVRKFPAISFKRTEKSSCSFRDSLQFPNGFSANCFMIHLAFNRNLRIFWLNTKHSHNGSKFNFYTVLR